MARMVLPQIAISSSGAESKLADLEAKSGIQLRQLPRHLAQELSSHDVNGVYNKLA
jgi:hypothetical protein